MTNLAVSTSFVQDKAHVSKSARFVPVQPSQISEVLRDHGLFLGHLKTAHAKKVENTDHQTTIARYVAEESSDMVRALGIGSTLDLLVRAPHLTGAIELRLGFFRGACANQWNAGVLVGSVKVSHTGNCLEALNRAIPALVARRGELCDQIRTMGERQLKPAELVGLANRVAALRLGDSFGRADVRVTDLLRVRRPQDARTDLFSAVNVLQENAMRYGIRYQLNDGERVRHMTTRPVRDTTATAVEMTGNIWEEAARLLDAEAVEQRLAQSTAA